MGPARVTDAPALLSVRDLRVVFDTRGGPLTAIDGVSFEIAAGEIFSSSYPVDWSDGGPRLWGQPA